MDVTALGISVESDGVVRGTKALDKFVTTSDKADKAADKLSGSTKRTSDGMSKSAQSASRYAAMAEKVERAQKGANDNFARASEKLDRYKRSTDQAEISSRKLGGTITKMAGAFAGFFTIERS